MLQAVDRETRKILAGRIRRAGSYFERLRGLIGAPPLGPGEGLWIPRCQGIHTFGMAYAIDAVFLDKEHRVLAVHRALARNRTGPVDFRAASVLEMAGGAAGAFRAGQQLLFEPAETAYVTA